MDALCDRTFCYLGLDPVPSLDRTRLNHLLNDLFLNICFIRFLPVGSKRFQCVLERVDTGLSKCLIFLSHDLLEMFFREAAANRESRNFYSELDGKDRTCDKRLCKRSSGAGACERTPRRERERERERKRERRVAGASRSSTPPPRQHGALSPKPSTLKPNS